ncbi:iron ABC transporter permease [Desulfobulbus sp. F1]|nr:iron ABC transporter permease [Desulfobulbus sp. F1]
MVTRPSGFPYITGGTLLLILLITMLFSAGMGFMHISASAVLQAVVAHFFPTAGSELDPVTVAVIIDVRLPRIFTAVLVGGMLAVCGTVFQAILLNPLADPYTLGVSSGAAFGASLVIVLQVAGLSFLPKAFTVPIFAFAGSIAALLAVLALAAGDRRLSSSSLILSGVIVAAILSAAIGFLQFLAEEQVGIIIFWLMGSLASASRQDILLLIPAALIGSAVCLFCGRDLNIMAAGERAAAALGVNTVRLRWTLLITCSLMTALCVAVSGIIGFVGLVVPHLLRHVAGPDNRRLIVLSFLGGGLLLLCADTLTRAVLPAEIPIGVLTSLLGGPFFACIFKKRQQDNGRN